MIVLSNGLTVTRCDGCASHAKTGDEFAGFMISWPVGFHPITSEPVMRFIYEKHTPGTPLMLHACEDCGRKIRRALKRGKIEQLPDGPLKKCLRSTVENPENKMAAFQIHFLKGSAISGA